MTTADGGQQGIDTFLASQANGQAPFAVVITDLGMPYVDGRKVAAAIKTRRPSTPVILLTGWGQRLEAEGDTPQSVDYILGKPPKMRSAQRDRALARPREVLKVPPVSRGDAARSSGVQARAAARRSSSGG